MKRLYLLFVLIGFIAAVFANPIQHLIVNKFWLDSNGDLNVRFNSGFASLGILNIDVFDGLTHFTDTLDLSTLPYYTKVYPDASVSPQQGYLSFSSDIYGRLGYEINWGASLDNDISPLASGECAMLIYRVDSWGEVIGHKWVKEMFEHVAGEYYPFTHSYINLSVTDVYGNPYSYLPVYLPEFDSFQPYCFTDNAGLAEFYTYSSKTRLLLIHPQTQQAVMDTTFFTEPEQTYNLSYQFMDFATDDPIAPPQLGVFCVYPNVLHWGRDASVRLSYDGKLNGTAHAVLYNLKGQMLAQMEYRAETANWQLPALSSGVYFIKLKDATHTLGTGKLIVLK